MEQEFLDCYSSLFDNAISRLKKAWMLKLAAMKSCNEQQKQWKLQRQKSSQSRKQSEESFSILSEDASSSSCDECEGHESRLTFKVNIYDLNKIDLLEISDNDITSSSCNSSHSDDESHMSNSKEIETENLDKSEKKIVNR